MAQNINRESVLTQQFSTLLTFATTATPINLPNSLIEPMQQSASTSLITGLSITPNAVNDLLGSVRAASTGFLAGLINPARLRMNLHLDGINGNALSYGSDNPVYNSNTTTVAKTNITSTTAITPPAILTGGTPSATTEETAQPSSLAFDGNNSTFWASKNDGIIPNAVGSALAALNYTTGATVTVTGNGAGGSITSLHVGAVANMFDGNSGTTFEWLNTLRANATNIIGSGTVWTIKMDFGVVRGLKAITVTDNNGDAGTWSYSNDDLSYTTFSTQSMTNGTITLTGVPASARYIKFQTGVGSGSHNTQLFYHFDPTYVGQSMNAGFDLSSGDTIVGTNYSIIAPTVGVRPSDWKLQGSNNGTTWTDLDTVTAYAGSWPFAGSFVNSTPYRYYQVACTASTSTFTTDMLIQDIKVWNTAVASPYITSGTPQILKYDAVLASTGTRYTVSASQNLPTDWVLEASNDNSIWTPLHTVTAYAGAFPITNTFVNTTPYRYWRLNITGSKFYSDVVTIGTFFVDTLPLVSQYDTSNKVFGTASARLRYGYLNGASVDAGHHSLGLNDWRYSGFYRFDTGFNNNQTLLSWSSQRCLDIVKTSTSLDVKYSTDAGVSFTTFSNPIVFNSNQWYWIAVGRSGNKIYVIVDGAELGNVDITGLSINPTAANALKIGADFSGANAFIGNIDEVEMFIGECPSFVVPVAARTTAYIPAVNWQSTTTYIPVDQVEVDVELFLDTAQFSTYGVPDVGNDAHLYISIDNGTTFTEMPLVRDGQLTLNTRIYRGFLNIELLNNTNQFIYKITSASGKVFKLDGAIFYWQDAESLALTAEMIWNFPTREITGGDTGATPADIWNYVNRTLTSSGDDAIKLTDIIPFESDIPTGDITVKQVFEIIAKRIARDKNQPKL